MCYHNSSKEFILLTLMSDGNVDIYLFAFKNLQEFPRVWNNSCKEIALCSCFEFVEAFRLNWNTKSSEIRFYKIMFGNILELKQFKDKVIKCTSNLSWL